VFISDEFEGICESDRFASLFVSPVCRTMSLNLTGSYVVDPTRSDSLEEVMKLQGLGWATRKIAAKFADSMALTVEQTEDRFLQTYTVPVK
jgi:hypothetical protein